MMEENRVYQGIGYAPLRLRNELLKNWLICFIVDQMNCLIANLHQF